MKMTLKMTWQSSILLFAAILFSSSCVARKFGAYQGNKKNGSSSDCMALHPSLHDGKLYHCSFATPQDEPVVSNDRMLHRSRPAIDVLSLMLRAPSQLGDVQRIAILRTQTA